MSRFEYNIEKKKEQKEKLRNQVYEAMVERSKKSNVELVRYVKKETAEADDL